MIKFSTWRIEGFNNIDDLQNVLLNNTEIVNNVEWDERNLVYRIEPQEGFALTEIREIPIEGENVRFLYFKVLIERQKRIWNENQPLSERITPYLEDVLIYEDNNTIKLVVLSTKRKAERVIKYMFPQEVWGVISEDNGIDKDLLYWVFHRLRDFPNVELVQNTGLYITGLISYMGKSKDEINAVRGNGVRVAALLGTLAFIFNNEDLRALRPEFQYNNHTVVAEIHLDNSNKIIEKHYRGNFMELEEPLRSIAILIFTCKIIIPTLIACYLYNRRTNMWSSQMKLIFLQTIGDSIRDTVDTELERIREEINRLNEDDVEILEVEEDFEDDEEIENEEFEED